jgi:hypothetical protein
MAVVTVPVVGKVDQRWLYAGAAGIAGIVGYAWWSGAGQDEGDVLLETPVTDFEPPTVVDSGISTGNITPTPGIAENNVEWLGMAQDMAASLGFATELANTALTKYLGGQSLTASEASVIRSVVVILGQPPQNGPFSIREAIPTPTTPPPTGGTGGKPAAPARVSATGGRARIRASWPAVAGATAYDVRLVRGYPQGTGGVWKNIGNRTSYGWVQRVVRKSTYTVEVRARNTAGIGPSRRSNPVTVTP